MDILPNAHANVLLYLIAFLRQLFEWPVFLENPEAKRRICIIFVSVANIVRAFAKVLIRSPRPTTEGDSRRKEALMAKLMEI